MLESPKVPSSDVFDESERKGDSGSRHLVFDDVVLCPDVESFDDFVRRYLFEHGLFGENRRLMFWALFYAWKGGKEVG